MADITKQEKYRKLGQAVGIYMGGAWVIIEASAFLAGRYDIDQGLLDLLIITTVCLLPSVFVFSLFSRRFSWWTISLYGLNIVLIVFALRFFLLNPLAVNPDDLRLIKLSGTKQPIINEKGHSLAILPFENNTGNPDNDYLIAGLHDGLISEVGRLEQFRVISRTSTLPFKDQDKPIKRIATELRVKSVMETSLSIIGEQVEVRLKLFIAFPEEKLIWSKSFESSIGAMPTLYKKVTSSVAESLRKNLKPAESRILNDKKSYNSEAYQSYLRGVYYTGLLTEEGFKMAEESFLRAVQLDSGIAAMSYGGLAMMWTSIRQMGGYPILEASRKVDFYFEKQISIDPKSRIPEAAILTWQKFDWEQAGKAWERDLKVYYNDPGFRSSYAHYLMIIGQWNEAWQNMNYAISIDPLNPWVMAFSAAMYMADGKVIEGQKKFAALAEMVPKHPMAIMSRFGKYHMFGEKRKAQNQLKLLCKYRLGVDLDTFIDQTFETYNYERSLEIVSSKLEDLSKEQFISPFVITALYRLQSNDDKTIEWMEEMHKVKDGGLPYFGIRDGSDLQKDPRFVDIMERIGLW